MKRYAAVPEMPTSAITSATTIALTIRERRCTGRGWYKYGTNGGDVAARSSGRGVERTALRLPGL